MITSCGINSSIIVLALYFQLYGSTILVSHREEVHLYRVAVYFAGNKRLQEMMGVMAEERGATLFATDERSVLVGIGCSVLLYCSCQVFLFSISFFLSFFL